MAVRPYRDQHPKLAQGAWVDSQATVIGDVVLGADVSVWPAAVIRGDVEKIRIGERTNVQDGAVLHVTHKGPYSPRGGPLRVGADVTVGHGAVLHACTIEDRCLIGMGSVILDGAHLESECLIAAGSVVSPGKKVASGTLWRGNPARYARDLTPEERDFMRYSAAHYVQLKNDYQID